MTKSEGMYQNNCVLGKNKKKLIYLNDQRARDGDRSKILSTVRLCDCLSDSPFATRVMIEAVSLRN